MAASRTHLLRLAAVLLLIATVVALRTLPITDWLGTLESWTRHHPVTGALVYVGISVVAIVALAPGWIPMTLAGLMFGLVLGFAYGLIAVVAGATAAFLTGRTLARGWVERRISGNPQLRALDVALGEQAFLIVMLTRVALVIPFNVLNYAYGLTRVGTTTYAAATAVGMVPIVGLYVYLGSVAKDVGEVLAGDADAATGRWWIGAIAVAAIVSVVLVVRRTVRRTLEQATHAPPEDPSRVS